MNAQAAAAGAPRKEMQSAALNEMTIEDIAARIITREVTSEQVVRACLDQIAAREPVVQAFASVDADKALAQARALDAESPRGPLHGVPIGIKDIIDTADLPTEMGSSVFRGHRPPTDASVVALLRAAGAIIIGKTHTAEFAGTRAPPTTNPWNSARTPGGSSSGSAAAVAAGMVPASVGTQTGGSVVRPAAFCGIFGFKPTFGRINRAGVKFVSEGFDTLGWMARSLGDLALLDAAIAPGDIEAVAKPPSAIRIGLCRTHLWDAKAQPETRAALESAASVLTEAGFRVEPFDLPASFAAHGPAREAVKEYERARAQAYEWNHLRESMDQRLAAAIERGYKVSYADYIAGSRLIEAARRELDALIEGWDCLLTPCANGEAPLRAQGMGNSALQSIWTMTYSPAINLPTHRGPTGLPVSIQLVGPRFGDRALLRVAISVWQAFGLGDRALPAS